MFCRVLGTLEIQDGQRLTTPNRRMVRLLLGILALRANLAVSKEELTEALWPEGVPPSAAANLRSYVAEVRRLLPETLEAAYGGYRLRCGVNDLDLLQFEEHLREGRAQSNPGRAADRLARAVGLWRGPVLAGLQLPALVCDDARRLADARRDAVEDLMEARLALGHNDDVIAELSTLLSEDGLRERPWRQLMLALYRSGRVGEALTAYQDVYRLLRDELCVQPGPQLQELHQRMLRNDQSLLLGGPASIVVAPWQPPSAPQAFVGRCDELDSLDGHGAAVITGPAGTGKTALALRWAHLRRERFPDGCLYVDLRGYSLDAPLTPAQAIAELFATLGVNAEPLPSRLRSELDGRRMLLILDNAHSPEQVRPLLPGGTCVVLVTSRDMLSGLVVRDGAYRLAMGLLPQEHAVVLLRRLIGARADSEPQAVGVLAEQCARLPLALRVAADLVIQRPHAGLTELTRELAATRLDTLDAGGDDATAVRSVLSWSMRHLDAAAADAFRFLGLHPGKDADAQAIAALADASGRRRPLAREAAGEHETTSRRQHGQSAASPLIGALIRAHLLEETSPGRYSSHDLLREYARELANALPEREQRAAMSRLLDQQAYTAALAMDVLYPHEAHRRPKTPTPSVPGAIFGTASEAGAWLDGELSNVLALARVAPPVHCGLLSGTVQRHLHTRGRYAEALELNELALAASRERVDRRAEAEAAHDLGHTLLRLGRHQQAAEQLERALGIHEEDNDALGESATQHTLGLLRYQQGQPPQALAHFERALWLYRRAGDLSGEGTVLGRIGLVREWMGEWDLALDCYREALAFHRATGFVVGEGDMLNNMAIVQRQTGDHAAAAERLQEALLVYRTVGDRGGEGAVLNNLGLVHTHRREWTDARSYLAEALALHREIRSRLAELETLNILGVLDFRSGHPQEGLVRFRATLAVAIELGASGAEMNAHYGLGQSLLALGQPQAARSHFESTAALAQTNGALSTLADALAGVARCANSPAHQRQAAQLYQQLGIDSQNRL